MQQHMMRTRLVTHAVADGVVQLAVVGAGGLRHGGDREVRQLREALEAGLGHLGPEVVRLHQGGGVAVNREAQQPVPARVLGHEGTEVP